jgi:hypothetical protein
MDRRFAALFSKGPEGRPILARPVRAGNPMPFHDQSPIGAAHRFLFAPIVLLPPTPINSTVLFKLHEREILDILDLLLDAFFVT